MKRLKNVTLGLCLNLGFASALLASTSEAAPGKGAAIVKPMRASDTAKAAETAESYKQRLADITPEGVLEWLKAGNSRFSGNVGFHGGFGGNYLVRRQNIENVRQKPLAAVLTCMDSRVAPELVFDTSIGDLFVTRIAANATNTDIVGSLEFAGSKVILVLGHSDCVGIKGACSNLEFGSLTQLLKKVKPAQSVVDQKMQADPIFASEIGEPIEKNPKYIYEVSHANAQQSARILWESSPEIQNLVKNKETILVSGILDVDTGKVIFDPPFNPAK